MLDDAGRDSVLMAAGLLSAGVPVNGLLSSLMLVELMLAVEDFCAEQGKNFSWTSDSTVSEQRSAYRSVASLADVILTMPDAAASREGA